MKSTVKKCWVILKKNGAPILHTVAESKRRAIWNLSIKYRPKVNPETGLWAAPDPSDLFNHRCHVGDVTPREIETLGLRFSRCTVIFEADHPGHSNTAGPTRQP